MRQAGTCFRWPFAYPARQAVGVRTLSAVVALPGWCLVGQARVVCRLRGLRGCMGMQVDPWVAAVIDTGLWSQGAGVCVKGGQVCA